MGRYGSNYPYRASWTFYGVGGNLAEDAVYPLAPEDGDGKPWMVSRNIRFKRTLEDIRELFDNHCVGCVVLECKRDRFCGDETNLWIRYAKARIQLVDNPARSYKQRQLIRETGLLQQS